MAARKEVEVIIPEIDLQNVTLRLVGDTPLIVHNWTKKAKQEIADKHTKKATVKKPKDPDAEFIDSIYWIEGEPEKKTMKAFKNAMDNGARIGFPAIAFKKCAVDGAYRAGATSTKAEGRSTIQIPADLIEIHGSSIERREDPVTIGKGGTDIRYRAQINGWWADVPVRFNANVMSLSQVVNMFQLGGFACGVGEWRVEKDGTNGAFHVETNASA